MITAPRVRVLTLNTWKSEGDYPARLRAIAAGLRALAPDVVLLQEVFRTTDGKTHTSQALADGLGLEHAYAAARAKRRLWQGREVESEAGLAVLARGSVTRVERLALPTNEAGGERIALLVDTCIRGVPVLAVCTHLSHLRQDDARRREQLETILAEARWREPDRLKVLGGDFNAAPGAPALAALTAHATLEVSDVFAGAASAPATHPLPPRVDRPGRRIDFLFTVTLRGEPGIAVHQAGVALAVPSDGVWPSDHAAVWADLVGTGTR